MKKLVSSILIAVFSLTVLMPATEMEENVTVTQTASTAMSQNTLDVIIGGDYMCDSWWLPTAIGLIGSAMAGPAFGIMWGLSVGYICSNS